MSRPDTVGAWIILANHLETCEKTGQPPEQWSGCLRTLLDYVNELEADLEAARHIIGSQPLEPPTVIATPESNYVRRSIAHQFANKPEDE